MHDPNRKPFKTVSLSIPIANHRAKAAVLIRKTGQYKLHHYPSALEPHPSRQNFLLGSSLVPCQINRVPDEGKGSPGLAPMLGTKANQHYPAFAMLELGQRDPVFDLVFAQQPS